MQNRKKKKKKKMFNPFHPDFMKWMFPLLTLDMSIVANRDVSQNKNRMANNVNPDETAHYEPSHQDLHCLRRYPDWSAELTRLTKFYY